jgi:hypothetical protein
VAASKPQALGMACRSPAIGFVWLCFSVPPNRINSHIILLLKSLRRFAFRQIGFVFSNYAHIYEAIEQKRNCCHCEAQRAVAISFDIDKTLVLSEIGFVFSNRPPEKPRIYYFLLIIDYLDTHCFGFTLIFAFFLLPFYLRLLAEAKSSASIIGATCVFDAKKYKTVDAVLAVSPCLIWNKKIFDFFYFCSALPSFLVENTATFSYSRMIGAIHRKLTTQSVFLS